MEKKKRLKLKVSTALISKIHFINLNQDFSHQINWLII